ncbi:MAG: prolyl oligopeptidase family serine peptidase [Leptospiraceae bacterium]
MAEKKNKKLRILYAAVALGLLYSGIAWYFSSVLIDFRTRPLDEDRTNLKISSPEEFGLRNEKDFELESQGIILKGWFYPAGETSRCAIVYHHGFTGTRYGGMKYAPMFAQFGCDQLFYDARKHGESGGEYGTFGYHEKQDLLNVIDWLKRERGLSDLNIAIMGESFGAATSLMAAGFSGREFAFLIAESPYSDLPGIVAQRGRSDYGPVIEIFIPAAFALARIRADFEPEQTSVLLKASDIKTPVFLLHSRQDTYTDSSNSAAVLDALTGLSESEKGLYFTDWGAKHARSIDTNREEFTKQVQGFLDRIQAGKRLSGIDTTTDAISDH